MRRRRRRASSSPASSPAPGSAESTPPRTAIRRASARVGLDPEGRVAFKLGGAARRSPSPRTTSTSSSSADAPPGCAEIARVLRPGGHLVLASARAPAPPRPATAPLRWRLPRARVRAGPRGRRRRRQLFCRAAARRPAGRPRRYRLPARWSDRQGMPLALLVNPSSGGGQGAEAAATGRAGPRRAPRGLPGRSAPAASSTASNRRCTRSRRVRCRW